jgi:hypothetical protein
MVKQADCRNRAKNEKKNVFSILGRGSEWGRSSEIAQ